MADVTVEIGGHSHTITCRDGEEAHLREIAALVDRKALEAREAVGGVSEVRQLLFASLLLADELAEIRQAGSGAAPAAAPTPDPSIAHAVERIADRVEALANRLENRS
jgi:cell division protein ZapA